MYCKKEWKEEEEEEEEEDEEEEKDVEVEEEVLKSSKQFERRKSTSTHLIDEDGAVVRNESQVC